MSARPSLFKETDIKRAVRAARTAGIDIERLVLGKDGDISIVRRKPAGDEKVAPTKALAGGELQPEPWD